MTSLSQITPAQLDSLKIWAMLKPIRSATGDAKIYVLLSLRLRLIVLYGATFLFCSIEALLFILKITAQKPA